MPALRAGFVPRQAARDTLETYGHRGMANRIAGLGVTPFEAVSLEPLAGLPPSVKLIWCYLASQSGAVKATNRGVGAALALSTKSVLDAMGQLETLGLLVIVERGVGSKPRIVRAVFPREPRTLDSSLERQ
jgi:hypothetical protein